MAETGTSAARGSRPPSSQKTVFRDSGFFMRSMIRSVPLLRKRAMVYNAVATAEHDRGGGGT